ncbi:hypothetical protein ACHAW5_005881 [Stephanodiscus triporus]|uniref:Uncharacterized protein n=1 Tax=Stephanodiscus triporus TaxID=2934178 RepID=A0ABD3QVN1_9STRA
MKFLKILLPLLAASSAPLPCSSFAPVKPSIRPPRPSVVASFGRGDDANESSSVDALERAGKVAGSAFVALALTFSSIVPAGDSNPFSSIASSNAAPLPYSSVTISRGTLLPPDDEVIKELEIETREAEKEAKIDERKARIEKSREAFFDYEARMAEEQEARIEAAEFRAETEYNYDREQAELLKSLEKKAEDEMKLARTPQEKAAKTREARELLRKEKEIERKERRAERAEKIFLAEEKQEQIIMRQKEDAALAVSVSHTSSFNTFPRCYSLLLTPCGIALSLHSVLDDEHQEEKKFEAVEKEYETVAELAKEEEIELRYGKLVVIRRI